MSTTDAWVPLTDTEEDQVWDRFFADFDFPWGIAPGKEPSPSITYSIAFVFERDEGYRYTLEDELNHKTLAALKQCMEPVERVYALDWQHQCYWFYPYARFNVDDSTAWAVPVLPDGDFYIFLAQDFRFCIYGDCLNYTITVYGQALLDAFAVDPPIVFDRPIRIDGEAIEQSRPIDASPG